LNLLIPSWAKEVAVYVNDKKQEINVAPNSYISLKRKWENDDKVKLVFNYNFYLETMPDDKNTIALFYGPTLLAFETNSEITLIGDKKEILNNLSKDKHNNIFYLKNNAKDYVLRPLYDIDEQSYGVYFTLREY
jgi:DUF1680 family protein